MMKKKQDDVPLTEAQIIASGIPKTWACVDCGVNTAPGCQNAAELAQGFRAKVQNPDATKSTIDDTISCVMRPQRA